MTSVPVTVQERIPMPFGPPGRPDSASAGLTLADVLRVLRQRIFLIVFIWILVIGASIGLTLYLLKHHSLYRGNAAVFVESPFPKTPMELTTGQQLLQVELMDRFVADQAVLLKDESLLRDVLKDSAIRATNWFTAQESESEALEELRDDLDVSQIPKTSYISVSFATRSSKDAPLIVNTVIDKYLVTNEQNSRQQYTGELQEYEATEKNYVERLESIRRSKEDFITTQLGVPGVTQGLNVVGETWRTLAAEVTRLEAEKLQYKAAYENLLTVDPTQIAISPQTRMMIEQDFEVGSLQNMKMNLEQQLLVRAQQGFGEKHREVEDLQSQLEVVEEQLARLVGEKENEVRDFQINQAQTLYLNATQAELQLRERMLESEDRQRDLDRGLAQFTRLEEEQVLLEDQLTRIRDYISQLQMIIKARGMVRVHRVGQAYEPDKRYFPKWEYNVPAGVLLGLMLGVGLAMLLEFVDTSIRTSRDIARHVHVPILGTVPDLDDEEVPIDDIELAAHLAPRSMVAEAFRGIRTNLLLSSPAERQRSVLVTSPKPEDGKTTVAVNLAISLAQSGRRVLLVDANFHQPRLHTLFPKAKRQGLSNVLIGQQRVEEVASTTDLSNLDVLTSGPIPPNPTELLSSNYLRTVIEQATERYDQIIFDGPPALLFSDVLVMTGSVDGIVLVCRAKVSSRGVVQRAREQIERIEGHIFGAVLNAARVARGGYFREQIRTYYDYQPEEALAGGGVQALPGEERSGDDSADET